MKPAFRKTFLSLHTWVGLVLGLFLVFTAVTGAVMAFRPSLERRLDARRFVVEPGPVRLPLDELVARAKQAHPNSSVESLRVFGDPTMPVLVLFVDANYVHMDPYRGEALGVRARYGDGFGWVAGLHKYLFLPFKLGEKFAAGLAIGFMFIALTGLAIWWPSTLRAVRPSLKLNPKLRGRAWNLNLHRVVGVWAMAFLLFSATTGAFISLEPFQRSVKPPAPPAPGAKEFVGFDAIARRQQELVPGAHEYFIGYPTKGIVRTYAIAADAPHPNARFYAWFHPVTGALIAQRPSADTPLGYRLEYWAMSLHTGVAGGPLLRLLLLLGALSLPLLVYTGALGYLRRSKRAASPGAGPPV